MSDPVGVAARVRETMEEDGSWMIVEPYADDRGGNNPSPFGRLSYSI